MAERVWQKFETNLRVAVPHLDAAVLPKLKTAFLSIDIHYLTSAECKNLVQGTLDKITEGKSKVYSHLLELKNSLKSLKKYKRKAPANEKEEVPCKVFIKEEEALIEEEMRDVQKYCISTTVTVEESNNQQKLKEFNMFEKFQQISSAKEANKPTKESNKPVKDAPKSSKENIAKPASVCKPAQSESSKSEERPNVKKASSAESSAKTVRQAPENRTANLEETEVVLPNRIEKKIQKLEMLLKTTQSEIEKREEEELDMDDLDDENNSYVVLDKLKAHCVKIWKSIAKLRKDDGSVSKRYHRKFVFDDSPYKELNKRIQKFVRQNKFPDYNDIRILLVEFTKEKKIGMSIQRISEFASDIFTNVGNKLKKLRISNFDKYFGNHLTDQVRLADDPILYNETLKRTLTRNYFEGKANLDKVIKDYTDRQFTSEIPQESGSDIATDTDQDELAIVEEDIVEEVEELEEEKADMGLEEDNVEKDEPLVPAKEVPPQYELADERLCEEEVRTDIGEFVLPPCALHEDEKKQPAVVEEAQAEEDTQELRNTLKVLPEAVAEDDLAEMEGHTFRFNLDQLQRREECTYFSEVIALSSSSEDEDDGGSSSSGDSCSQPKQIRDSGFSTKVGELLCGQRVEKKEPIFISLDDSDEEKAAT